MRKKLFSNVFGAGIFTAGILLMAMPAASAFADGPTISGAVNITAEAASSTGAVVTFNVTAVDASSTPVGVFCTPSSGSTFAIATTKVTCSASDGAATSTATFNVNVADTTPPTITAPANQTFTATSTPAAPNLVKATATDMADPNPSITYSPTSFSVGTTTVTWTATDASGNKATTTSNVYINAAATVPVHLEIDTATTTLFNGDVNVYSCTTPNNATSTINGFCAFSAAGVSVGATWSSYGAFVNSIGGTAGGAGNYWLWFLNSDAAQVGIDSYMLQSGDRVLWTIGREPMKISASPISPAVGATTTVSVLGFDTNAFDFEPLAGAAISGVNASTTTGVNGKVYILATSTNPISISAAANRFLPSGSITITPRAAQATLAIRDGGTLLGPFTFNLPNANASSVLISPTASTSTYPVPARSVLAALSSLDASHGEFDVTDLQYFSSFNSFMVNCISIPSVSSTPACSNWQYAVNGIFPQVGMDSYLLSDGDSVFLFFDAASWKVSTDKTSVSTGSPITVTAQKYDPSSNGYVAASGETVGAVQFDSNFNPTEFANAKTDANGHGTLSLSKAGNYNVGVQSSGYFPAVPVTISAPDPFAVGGGVATGIQTVHHDIDINKAIQFLSAKQRADGSFGSSLYTDWAAIALAAGQAGSSADKTAAYLKSAPNTGMSATDYERHGMALMALGISPYDGTDTNYIKKITDSFDGVQIGDPSLVNDDIFAIFPLIKSGYSANDPMLQKIISFVISKQRPDGSWEGGVDMTAAAIQALSLFPSAQGVPQAQAKARQYLSVSQQSNGGFGGIGSFSTSWVIQAIAALSESALDWKNGGNTPGDYLYSLQQVDGGIEPPSTDLNSRIWATSYAIPAELGKTWVSILRSFSAPASVPAGAAAAGLTGSGGLQMNAVNATTTVATTTVAVSSSTIASSSTILLRQENGTSTATSTIASASSTKPVILPAATTTQSFSVFPAITADESGKRRIHSAETAKNEASHVERLSSVEQSSSTGDLQAVSEQKQKNTGKNQNLAAVELSAGVEGLRNMGSAIIHGITSFFSGIASFFWRL